MGQPPERAISARDLSRPFSTRGVPVARDAARSRAAGGRSARARPVLSERTRRRSLHQVRLRERASAVRIRAVQAVDRCRIPARDHGEHPARQPVLRRFVRGEFREPRAVRRRDHLRAPSVHREDVSRTRPVGARAVRRFDRRLGSARRAGVLPGRVQRHVRQLPGPDRFPALHQHQHLRRSKRVLRSKAPGAGRRGPATATISARRWRPSSR